MTIREAVEAERIRRGWSVYQLAKAVEKAGAEVTADAVYKFIAKEGGKPSDPRVSTVEPILDALGLEVRRKR